MRTTTFALPAFLSFLSFSFAAPGSITPPTLKYLFTATVDVGKPLSPIRTLASGTEVVEPLVGGNITGPAINATIFGGVAYPTLYNNQTVETASLIIYGNTTDGQSYFVRGEGIGKPSDQIARITIDIGGPYTCLSNSYILAELLPNQAKTIVTVHGYEVLQSLKTGGA